MKKVVPFTKTLTFKTMIAEVTDIEVKHTLKITQDHEIEGDILIDGTYKMTDASQIQEEFHYKLPFMIEIDSKYDLSDIEITIGDFYFEIINEQDLKVNVEIDIDGLEEITVLDTDIRNDEVIEIPVETEEEITKLEINPLDKLTTEIEEDLKEEVDTNDIEPKEKVNVSSIFSSISKEETYSTYYVYIVRENDTLDKILDKYSTTKEQLQNYNDLNELKTGTKLIIPCSQNE